MNKVKDSFLWVLLKICTPIQTNLVFFLFLYILGITTTLVETIAFDFKIPRFSFFSWIFDLYVLCVLLMIIPQRIRPYVKGLLAFVFYSFSVVEVFCVELFRAKISPDILTVITETNNQESSEFIDKYIGFGLLGTGVGLLFLVMVLHVISVILLPKIRHLIGLIGLIQKDCIHVCVRLCVVCLVAVSSYFCFGSRIDIIGLMFVEDVDDADNYVSNFSQNTPINDFLFSVKMLQLSSQSLDVLAETQQYVTVDSCNFTSPNIVLIIGESYIKDHSQLYGYSLPTTPLQLGRTDSVINGRLIPFSDVISPYNLTSRLFKNVFSLHSVEEKSDWSHYPLFPVLFRMAGYNVTFITNQFVQSINADIFNISGGLFLNHPKLSTCQFDHRNTISHQYDMGVLEDYDSLKAYSGDNNLIIFHLKGQHIDFNKRFPQEKHVFDISDYAFRSDLSDSEKQLVADYDNATHYNDEVLDSIIRTFECEDAVLIYMPDHGEECFDELHRMGRIPGEVYTPEVLRQEYRIPFWIWCSQCYIDKHPHIFEAIDDAKDRPFMIDDLSHMLLYLAGIHCDSYREERNILSSRFCSSRKRMIRGIVNYDEVVSK